jgi:hypothetical protein
MFVKFDNEFVVWNENKLKFGWNKERTILTRFQKKLPILFHEIRDALAGLTIKIESALNNISYSRRYQCDKIYILNLEAFNC